jgi:hypothetical protein
MRLIILFFFISSTLLSQSSFKNALKFNLVEPFIEGNSFYPFERNFSISYERVLSFDPRLEQVTLQLNCGYIYDIDREIVGSFNGNDLYADAFYTKGYNIVPEVKVYLGWDAPLGLYISTFFRYTDYITEYNSLLENVDLYSEQWIQYGRGLMFGYQFIFSNYFICDIGVGYDRFNFVYKRKAFTENEFVDYTPENPDNIVESVRIMLGLGIPF